MIYFASLKTSSRHKAAAVRAAIFVPNHLGEYNDIRRVVVSGSGNTPKAFALMCLSSTTHGIFIAKIHKL